MIPLYLRTYVGEFSNVDITQDLDRLLALQEEDSACSLGMNCDPILRDVCHGILCILV